MSKNGSQFIINLVKLPEGYAFQSFQQGDNVGSKKKNTSKQKPKNPSNRTIHRIFRELALDPLQPQILLNPIAEESEPAPKHIEPQVQEEFSAQLKRQNGLPQSPAKWFEQASIHQIQKDSLPQFFNGKSYKTPELYMKFRNFIVTLYRKNPAQYLTKIACRRVLRGDVNTIMKIHSFLQKQGIINFGVSKQGNYTFTPSVFSRALNQQSKYGVAVDKIQDYDQQIKTETPDMTNITITTVSKVFSKGNRTICHKCQSICGILWYKKKQKDQTQKNQSVTLCLQCFDKLNPDQAQQYTRADIVKRIQSNTPQDTKAIWSIDDNLKLLQFVSKQNESWEQLENSFDRKKTFDDIMLQFMQFPIGNFNTSSKDIPEEAIEDNYSFHTDKLLNRMKKSYYGNQKTPNPQPQDLNNQKFLKQILTVTKTLFKKFQTQIQTNLNLQKTLQQSLVQLQNMRTISKKSIQNQQPPLLQMMMQMQSQIPKKKQQFDENSLESHQLEFNEREEQEEHEEEIGDGGDGNIRGEFEDFLNKLEYN